MELGLESYRFRSSLPNPQGMLETGFKMLLPFSPWSEPHFRVQERGGGESATWGRFGAEYLRRLIMVYVNGTY